MQGKQQPRKLSKRIGALLALHAVLVLYSLTGILGKMAAEHDVLSIPFFAYYAGVIFLLGIYALAWQQVIKKFQLIKHLPLTTAFANKAITVLWGMLWGSLLFAEDINAWKIIGALIVSVGVILFVRADKDDLASEHRNELVGEDL